MNNTTPRAADTAHTPGPWRVGDAGSTVFGPPTGNPSAEIIATITIAPIVSARKRANARLIAAAPELLAALQSALPLLRGLMGQEPAHHLGKPMADQIQRARCDAHAAVSAAIAKATA